MARQSSLLLALGVALVFAACTLGAEENAGITGLDAQGVEVPAASSPKTSFLQEFAGASSKAGEKMSLEQRMRVKAMFMKVAGKLHGPKLRADALIVERMASDALDDDSEAGSGLDVIFQKIEDLEQEINDEQAQGQADFDEEKKRNSDQIMESSKSIEESNESLDANNMDNKRDLGNIVAKKNAYRADREVELEYEGCHQTIVRTQATRAAEIATTQMEVDERNKAIDVLTKALFLVCERFNRYKDTDLCVQIKSQPDVEEPDRYESDDPIPAKEQTEETHAESPTASPWFEAWQSQRAADIGVQGIQCPETPNDCPQANTSGITYVARKEQTVSSAYASFDEDKVDGCGVRCAEDDTCVSFNWNMMTHKCYLAAEEGTTDDNADVTSGVKPPPEDDNTGQYAAADMQAELGEGALSKAEEAAEAQARSELRAMANIPMLPKKYAVPLNMLAEASKAGAGAAKRKSLVEIIIDVLMETRQEQADAIALHEKNLDGYYDIIYEQMNVMNNKEAAQNVLIHDWLQLRGDIDERLSQNKVEHGNIKDQIVIKERYEDMLAEASRVFGMETALRMQDLENIRKLLSLLRALYDSTPPTGCPETAGVMCTDPDAGWCIFSDKAPSNDVRCSCNVIGGEMGWYGDACQYRMCPGLGDTLYTADEVGVCSNRGVCNTDTGECTCNTGTAVLRGGQYTTGFYHGPNKKCEYRHTPPSQYPPTAPASDASEDVVQAYNKAVSSLKAEDRQVVNDEACSGRASFIDLKRGKCQCSPGFFGQTHASPNLVTEVHQTDGGCEETMCPGPSGTVWPSTSTIACNGHGVCNGADGVCECEAGYRGTACEDYNCVGNDGEDGEGCDGHGQCQRSKESGGTCACQAPFIGITCNFRGCPADCGGTTNGRCNRNDGKCVCNTGFTGDECQESVRCAAGSLNTPETNWYTIWDTPGWIACPTGQLLYGLKRGSCDALSCVDSGSCAAACQGTDTVYQLRHCYHELGWYNSFDMAGWSKCLPNYFVAGLYRSCESLYCLQMAKCCSLVGARAALCGEAEWGVAMATPNTLAHIDVGTPNTGEKAFITGFERGAEHTLAGITKASYCRWVKGY